MVLNKTIILNILALDIHSSNIVNFIAEKNIHGGKDLFEIGKDSYKASDKKNCK